MDHNNTQLLHRPPRMCIHFTILPEEVDIAG